MGTATAQTAAPDDNGSVDRPRRHTSVPPTEYTG